MTLLKKNTPGGTAGITWEAGEVKDVYSLLAEELAVLAPDDYEIVTEAPAPAETPESDGPAADADNVVETPAEEPVVATPVKATKPRAVTKKQNKTPETPSAE